ncbi:MAG: DUF1294 domain-containing protein [Xanthomonadales bacterium]|nr:DUF1294 domain-containing protein [Xanthomonadales bacterium]
MRHRGIIERWNDQRGFGFIRPEDGSGDVFLHISALESGNPRPSAGKSVSYRLGQDRRGRARAKAVRIAGATRASVRRRPRRAGKRAALVISPGFLAGVGALVTADRLPPGVLWLYLAASIVTFVVYAMDKSAARQGGWRVPESTLHLLAVVGGWPGGLIAQRVLRHKSRKPSFQAAFWLMVVLNCAALVWVLTPEGSAALVDFIRDLPWELRQWL